MTLLLDTQAFLWFINDDDVLTTSTEHLFGFTLLQLEHYWGTSYERLRLYRRFVHNGEYDEYDEWVHSGNIDRIKSRYAIGSVIESRMLSLQEINKFAPHFVSRVGMILGKTGTTAMDIVSRKGRKLTERQVQELLAWLDEP